MKTSPEIHGYITLPLGVSYIYNRMYKNVQKFSYFSIVKMKTGKGEYNLNCL